MEGGVGTGLGAGKETDLGDAEEAGVEGRVEEQVGACLEGRAGTGVEEGMEARLGESLGTSRNSSRRASRLQVIYPPSLSFFLSLSFVPVSFSTAINER